MLLYEFVSASSNQFHKYYQYGEFENCDIHQKDLKNCFLWKTRKSFDALVNMSICCSQEYLIMITSCIVTKLFKISGGAKKIKNSINHRGALSLVLGFSPGQTQSLWLQVARAQTLVQGK